MIELRTVSFQSRYLSGKSRLFTAPTVFSMRAVVLLAKEKLSEGVRFHVRFRERSQRKFLLTCTGRRKSTSTSERVCSS